MANSSIFVTGIDTDGEDLGVGDALTVLTGGAIRVATVDVSGIRSGASAARATVFGDVAADGDGIRLTGDASAVMIGQSGNVVGRRFGVWLGTSTALDVGLRNEGTITGYEGGVRLEGRALEVVNTGTIVVSTREIGIPVKALTLASIAGSSSYLMNTGTIVGGRASSASVAVEGGLGNDIIHNNGLIVGNIILGAGDDRYYGEEGFWEGSYIYLGTGRNIAYGGAGAEIFHLIQEGDRLDDVVDGGAGIDALVIQDGDVNVRVDLRVTVRQETGVGGLTLRNVETLSTGEGWDRVTGNSENNIISTGFGNDTLEGGMGDDILQGGGGDDIAIFSGTTGATVDLRLQDGQAQNTGYGLDTLVGIESLEGGAGDDVFWGTDAANLLSGSGGNDTLWGGGGDDTLDGGSGTNTVLFVGAKADYQVTPNGNGSATVKGPDGTDVVRNVRFLQFADGVTALTNAAPVGLGLSAQSVVENAPVGSVVATLSARDADGDAITYSLAAGSPFALVGTSLVVANAIDFEASRQHSVVVQARDNYGGATSQAFTIAVANAVETTPFVLRGGTGADVLQGEAGNDTIHGGAGSDMLSGNAGKDVFVFDARTGRTNVDAVTDFRVPDDSLWLDNAVFKSLGKGSLARPQKLAADAFVTGARAQDREDRIVYDKNSGKLYYDQNGTGSKAQVQIATLSKGLKMTAADFFVI